MFTIYLARFRNKHTNATKCNNLLITNKLHTDTAATHSIGRCSNTDAMRFRTALKTSEPIIINKRNYPFYNVYFQDGEHTKWIFS